LALTGGGKGAQFPAHRAANPRHDRAEPQPRHAEARVGGGDPDAARDEQIDPRAEVLAVRESQGRERRVVVGLQQLLDPDESQQQFPFGSVLEIREVESRAEMLAVAREDE
jgi:hypothetical protein